MATAYALAHLRRAPLHADVLEYLERIDSTLTPFGGRFIVHGGAVEPRAGSQSFSPSWGYRASGAATAPSGRVTPVAAPKSL
ncbi:hypothetical protein C7C45_28680 [Micromonospora arborensis]|uniref:DUF1330 domain-containing protein n=1 Tax=Micromonospora arborensis TaxID=2116518 RepID=A0A318NCA3_9ACTN|nr:DUF1330 domain-containing protein [Micromonospora arborensis]PYC65500.1 hypothetical protein C7C45_28680 [Micromonospora arborensis]